MKTKKTKKAVRTTKRTVKVVNGGVEMSLPEPMLVPPTCGIAETSNTVVDVKWAEETLKESIKEHNYYNKTKCFEFFEQFPSDGGDIKKPLFIMDTTEDFAYRIINLMNNADVNWGCYGYRDYEIKPKSKSIWTRISEWLNSASSI